MPNNIFYVFDNNRIKVEGMTKEQIYNAIAEATGHTPQDVDSGFITTIVEQNKNKPLHFWFGTKAEYEAITTKAHNTFYIFSDDTDIDDLQAAVEELQQAVEQIGAIEIDIQNIEADVDALDTRVTNAEARVDEAVEDVNEAVETVEAMQSDVTQLQTDVDNVETDVTALQGTTGTLRDEIDNLGNDVTQINADVTYLLEHVSEIQTKNGQVLLNTSVQSGTVSVDLTGTYGIEDFSVVKVRFVSNSVDNKEILCNVYHAGSNVAIISGSYVYPPSVPSGEIQDSYSIKIYCNESTNKITANHSAVVRVSLGNVPEVQNMDIVIDKITGVA